MSHPDDTKDAPETATGPNTLTVVEGNTRFAFDLYTALRKREGNLFFSPYSISMALAMAYAGARKNTALQMAQALHFPTNHAKLHPIFAEIGAQLSVVCQTGGNRLNIANSMRPQQGYPFLETYSALLEKYYKAEIDAIDYIGNPVAACKIINDQVEAKTGGKIKNLLQPEILDSLTRLVLVNAIYFKGSWAFPFNKRFTYAAPFWVTPQKSVQVPMMVKTESFGYYSDEQVQVLELPYAGDDFSMILVLPQKRDGLPALEADFSAEKFWMWENNLDGHWEVQLRLPKFEFSVSLKLIPILAGMGMRDVFDQSRANFAGMDGSETGLYIAAAVHQAFVSVDEEGTEAAAATGLVAGIRSEPPSFYVDHPFMFLIRDNRIGSILFIGRVTDPTANPPIN